MDISKTLKSLEGDEELLQEIITEFEPETQKMLLDIKEAFQKKNCRDLERAAHKLKGTLGNFYAQSALNYAQKIEFLARDNRLDGFSEIYKKLEQEIDEVKNAMSNWNDKIIYEDQKKNFEDESNQVTSKLFDLEKVMERVENDLSLLQDVVEIYVEEADDLLQNIFSSIEQKNVEGVGSGIHTFKGVVGNFFAQQALQLAAQIEMAAQQSDFDRANDYFRLLENEQSLLIKELLEVVKNKDIVYS